MGEVVSRCGRGGCEPSPLSLTVCRCLLGNVELVAYFGEEWFEPHGDDTAPCGGRLSPRLSRLLVGKGAALGDGGDVGAVEGQDGFEGVSGFADIGGVGDHAEQVPVAAAGGGDVQAAAARHRRDERHALVDGVGLVAVLGRRVT